MFSDICGFTAWSSTREPVQVFVLLQAVYQEFDKIAKKRNVYKVETIGDSYVAVTGLPNPQPNHAVLMARFASDCLHAMIFIARELETKLGPDTGDLCMRFGKYLFYSNFEPSIRNSNTPTGF
jgi:class 3 adenylate cyclase